MNFVLFCFRTPSVYSYGWLQRPRLQHGRYQQGADRPAAPHPVPRGGCQHPDRPGAGALPQGFTHRLPLLPDQGFGEC